MGLPLVAHLLSNHKSKHTIVGRVRPRTFGSPPILQGRTGTDRRISWNNIGSPASIPTSIDGILFLQVRSQSGGGVEARSAGTASSSSTVRPRRPASRDCRSGAWIPQLTRETRGYCIHTGTCSTRVRCTVFLVPADHMVSIPCLRADYSFAQTHH